MTEFKFTTFEDGIIGTNSKFLAERFGVKPLLGRLWTAAMIAATIPAPRVYDKLGEVSAQLYVIDIEETGEGKSPPLKTIRKVLSRYGADTGRQMFGPSSFSPQSFVESFTGHPKTKNRPERPPRPNQVIIQDEASKWFAERSAESNRGQDENLSLAWDGFIPPNSTISRGDFDGMEVNLSILGATSHAIFYDQPERFFLSGAGCRFNWTIGEIEIPKFEEDFFNTKLTAQRDEEGETKMVIDDPDLDQFISGKVEELKRLEGIEHASLYSGSKTWLDFANKLRDERVSKKWPPILRGFRAKQLQQSIKLGMNYAASRFSVQRDESALLVEEEDIERGVRDSELLFKEFQQVIELWQTETKKDSPVFSKERALNKVVGIIRSKTNGRSGWALWSEVLPLSNLYAKELNELVTTLVQSNRVEQKLGADQQLEKPRRLRLVGN